MSNPRPVNDIGLADPAPGGQEQINSNVPPAARNFDDDEDLGGDTDPDHYNRPLVEDEENPAEDAKEPEAAN